jgi:hypothetical protein
LFLKRDKTAEQNQDKAPSAKKRLQKKQLLPAFARAVIPEQPPAGRDRAKEESEKC